MSSKGNKIYEFESFRIDVRERIFTCLGERIPITDKAFDLLCALVSRDGRLATKDDLLSEVWPDSFVEENTLDKNISVLRRLFAENGQESKFIETVRGHGYRFVGEVRKSGDDTEADAASSVEASADAPASPAEPKGKLRRYGIPALAAAAVMLVVLGVYFVLPRLRSQNAPPASADGITKIAVLPFVNKTQDPQAEYLANGISEGIIDGLSQISSLKVMSRHSVARFTNDPPDIQKIRTQLGVDSLVTGEIDHVGDQIVVSVRMINLHDDSQIWGERYVNKLSDLVNIQTEIARDVAENLRIKLAPGERQAIARLDTTSPEAYRAFLLGRYHADKATEADILESIDYYRKAVAADPSFAAAYVGIADCYRVLSIADLPVSLRDAMQQSRAAAEKALAIDPNLATAHSALAWSLCMHDRDWQAAEAEFRKALDLSPGNADIRRGYAHMLSLAGRHDEAIAEGHRAVELDPLSLPTNGLDAQFLFFGGRTDDALAQLRTTFQIEPNYWIALNLLGRIYTDQGKYAEALAEFRKAKDLSGGSAVPITELGYTYAKLGERGEALNELKTLTEDRKRRFVPFYSYAMIYNGLGERDLALKYLERSVDAHESDCVFIKAHRRWDAFANDARYIAILKKLNLNS